MAGLFPAMMPPAVVASDTHNLNHSSQPITETVREHRGLLGVINVGS